jgi:hypothetical protein
MRSEELIPNVLRKKESEKLKKWKEVLVSKSFKYCHKVVQSEN